MSAMRRRTSSTRDAMSWKSSCHEAPLPSIRPRDRLSAQLGQCGIEFEFSGDGRHQREGNRFCALPHQAVTRT
jgi:hypothetical protein